MWTIEASGDGEVAETYGFLTDVMPGYNTAEQRVSLRAVPVESLEFSFLCTDARQSGLADSLLFGLQDEVLAVPLWQHGSRLTSTTIVGASTFFTPDDPRDLPYRVGGLAVLWRDPFTYELFTVSGVTSNSVTTSDTASVEWPTGSVIMPARLARVASRVGVVRSTTGVLAGRPVFTAETAEPTVPAAESFALYRSLPILDVLPDRGDGTQDEVDRKAFLMDSKTGTRAFEAPAAAPQTVRGFSWWCASRAEAKVLREFINNRRGRARPFWVLAWQQDFALAGDHAPNSSVLVVLARDYAARVFPAGQARRHLAVRVAGATYYRHVESAVDNLNGTESLTLDLPVPVALTPDSTLTASLRYSRLDVDEPRIEWSGGHHAECLLPMRELPAETPA